MSIVFLDGEKVALRPLEKDDLERCRVWLNGPNTRKFLSRRVPISQAAEEKWFEQHDAGFPPSSILLAIVEKESGRHVGNVGLHNVDWLNRNAVFGIVLGEDSWGKGFGTEAALLLLKYAFDGLCLHRVASAVFANNCRSLRLHAKVGFAEEGRLRDGVFSAGEWVDIVGFGILEDEWRRMHPSK